VNRKKNQKKLQTLCILAAAVFVFFVSGCGYSVRRHSALPFTEISIGRIDNATLEPKLQDKLYKALTEEFMKQGISVSPAADLKLTGTISKFDMVGLSDKNGVTAEYRVIVLMEFRITDGSGKTKFKTTVNTPFIVDFTGSPDLGVLMATKEIAEERAMADIAMEIAGALIYK
jgi:outer membrane lipopolysaccharide assembly protein LptE/RlpB